MEPAKTNPIDKPYSLELIQDPSSTNTLKGLLTAPNGRQFDIKMSAHIDLNTLSTSQKTNEIEKLKETMIKVAEAYEIGIKTQSLIINETGLERVEYMDSGKRPDKLSFKELDEIGGIQTKLAQEKKDLAKQTGINDFNPNTSSSSTFRETFSERNITVTITLEKKLKKVEKKEKLLLRLNTLQNLVGHIMTAKISKNEENNPF